MLFAFAEVTPPTLESALREQQGLSFLLMALSEGKCAQHFKTSGKTAGA